MQEPLARIRVIDSTVHLAGPYCARFLAELGAEVIKVEPPGGEANRRSPPLVNGESLLYNYYNVNKKSLCVDLKKEKGRQVMLDLVRRSDVFLSNYRPGVLERLKLGYEDLRKVNERIIYTTITGFGYTGPYSEFAGYDPLAQAVTGLMDANASKNGSPKISPMSLDYSAAMVGTITILAALYQRMQSGKGQRLDLSLFDVGMVYAMPWIAFHLGGMQYRSENRSLVFAPYNLYRTTDGYVMIAVNEDRRWEAFLRAIGRDDLVGDSRFATVQDRVNHYDDIDALISKWTEGTTTEEVMKVVRESGGAAAPVKAIPEVLDDPHAQSRQMLVERQHPRIGKLVLPGSALKLGEASFQISQLAPALGEHNTEVLTKILDYDSKLIGTLKAEGVISNE